MPTSTSCFSNEADVPTRIGHRDAAEPAPSGVHRKGLLSCFSYSAGAPLGAGNRDVALPVLPGLRSIMFGTCFRH
jgi:hypothetical protein